MVKPGFVVVGNSKFSKETIDGNMKLEQFTIEEKCPRCGLLKELGEIGICKYCRRVLQNDF